MSHVNKRLYPGNEGKNVYQFQDKKVACFAFRVLVIITVTFDVALWYITVHAGQYKARELWWPLILDFKWFSSLWEHG